ncbi:MAG: dihydrofolate reductase [Bacteroidia bacterium]|nr:dihydrofolate reductase [Bacteroidia bacterium]
MSKLISIIVAIADNNAIGKDNKLLCHLPADLKRFKQLTTGHPVIMGKNTYLSLPIRPLPARINIVITDDQQDYFEGCTMAYSIEDAVNKCPEEECFVIGGGLVYRQFLPIADRLYITRVHKSFEADTFFPDIQQSEWELLEEPVTLTDDKSQVSFTFLVYEKAIGKSNKSKVLSDKF